MNIRIYIYYTAHIMNQMLVRVLASQPWCAELWVCDDARFSKLCFAFPGRLQKHLRRGSGTARNAMLGIQYLHVSQLLFFNYLLFICLHLPRVCFITMFIPSYTNPSTTYHTFISHLSLFSRSNETKCGFEGNNDIYGIGIRIGIYSQILAVWFANYFLSSEVQVLRDTVSIFGLAVLVVSILFTIHPENVYAVEVFIMLQILAWSCLMAVHAKSSYAAVNLRKRTVVRRVANDCVNLCMVALHIWFWWKGLDELKITPCGTWMMYIIKTDMYGWARSVMKAFSVFVGVTTVYWVGIEYAKLVFSVRMARVREEFAEALKVWDEAEEKRIAEVLSREASRAEDASVHDACSQLSSGRRSPVEMELQLDQEATSVRSSRTADGSSTPSIHRTPSRASVGCPELIPGSLDASTITSSLNHYTLPEYAILRSVYESELYITNCINATPFKVIKNGKSLPPLTMIRSILSPAKYQTSVSKQSATAPPTWLQCQYRLFKAVLTFHFPARSFSIYTHLQQTHLLDPLNGPFQVLASFTYIPSSPATTPTWQTTTLASSLLLTSPSTPKKVWLAWYYMLIDLVVHILVMLQLELTLKWNHVDGLSDLWTSVGQLIPFIIGVSGLTLVLGRWVGRRWDKKNRGKGLGRKEAILEVEAEEGNLFGLSEEVRESYEKWKVGFEGSTGMLGLSVSTV